MRTATETDQRVRVVGRHIHRGRPVRGQTIALRREQIRALQGRGSIVLVYTAPPALRVRAPSGTKARSKRPLTRRGSRALRTPPADPEPNGRIVSTGGA